MRYSHSLPSSRRQILRIGCALAGGALLDSRLAGAAALVVTPTQMQGPFYPDEFPLDRDNDLVAIDGSSEIAHGTITEVSGHLFDEKGQALSGVLVEIWQVNGYGRYHHPDDDQDLPMDPNFQGYGRAVTDTAGAYRFRTVKPVAYPGRAPHIHFALSSARFATFYTQMYIAGAPENQRDFLLSRIRERQAREALMVSLQPSATPKIAELTARFDIVLGRTALSRQP